MDLCGVDSVSHIMALAVCNVSDKALGFSKFFADHLYNIDISHFIMSTDIINFTFTSLVYYKVDSTAMILNIKPVSYIFAFPVYGEGLVMKRVCNHKRDQLLREVIRTVVV